MAKLPNPNDGKKFDRIQGDYGYRDAFGEEETVHIPSNTSNMNYYTPKDVLSPNGCKHNLIITDIGKREVECENCHWAFAFHAGRNYHEENGQGFVTIKNKKYPLSL